MEFEKTTKQFRQKVVMVKIAAPFTNVLFIFFLFSFYTYTLKHIVLSDRDSFYPIGYHNKFIIG